MAAPAVNNIQSTSSSLTLSYTVPTVTDGRLVVMVGLEDVGNNNPITGVTFGASSLTQDADAVSVLGSNSNRMAIYSLASPTAGTDTITISASNERIGIIAFTLSDCGAKTDSDTDVITSSGSTMTTNVTTVGADNIVVSCTNNSTTSATTNPAGTTAIRNLNSSSTVRFQSFYEDAASAGLVSSTASGFDIRSAMATVSYAPSGGGGPTYSLTLDAGAYAYTGSSVSLAANRALTIDSGSYTYSGSAISLSVGRAITLGAGTYAYTGNAVNVKASRKISIDNGSYSYTGNAVTLTYNPSGGPTYQLTLDAGIYNYTGSASPLAANRKLAIDSASYSYNGSDSQLSAGRAITVTPGSYSISGQDVSLKASRAITIDAAVYDYSGYPVTLSYSGQIISLISGYSVEYKQDDITGDYKLDDVSADYEQDYITARFL